MPPSRVSVRPGNCARLRVVAGNSGRESARTESGDGRSHRTRATPSPSPACRAPAIPAGPPAFPARRRPVLEGSKQRALPALPVGNDDGGPRQRPVKLGGQRCPRPPEPVAGAAADQRLDHPPVHRPAVHPLAQVRQRAELAPLLPRRQVALNGDRPHPFDCGPPEPDAPKLRPALRPAVSPGGGRRRREMHWLSLTSGGSTSMPIPWPPRCTGSAWRCPPCRWSSSRRKTRPGNWPSNTRSGRRRSHRRRRGIC